MWETFETHRVELDGKATDITDSVRATTRALHGRETDEDRGGARRVGEDRGVGVLGRAVVVDLEDTVRARTACVDDTLGDALVVEAVDLLAADLVLERVGAGGVTVGDTQPAQVVSTGRDRGKEDNQARTIGRRWR
jgi:hypothetical protein